MDHTNVSPEHQSSLGHIADPLVLMRALKVTGDATKQEDYESCKFCVLCPESN
jgi:hypothetical protein